MTGQVGFGEEWFETYVTFVDSVITKFRFGHMQILLSGVHLLVHLKVVFAGEWLKTEVAFVRFQIVVKFEVSLKTSRRYEILGADVAFVICFPGVDLFVEF